MAQMRATERNSLSVQNDPQGAELSHLPGSEKCKADVG